MARRLDDGVRGASVALLVVAGLISAVPAPAQTSPSPSKVPYLDPKIAAKLVVAQERPPYPTIARINYIQGQVRVQLRVTREGKVSESHVVRGHPFLAVEALKAIRRWLYRPFKTKSGPTEFSTVVDVNFALHTKPLKPVPSEPELDLSRQVRPPEVLERPLLTMHRASVRMRVLVNDKGTVLDSRLLTGLPQHLAAARRELGRWTFRPARWGALAVPWYLEVDIPVDDWPSEEGTAGSQSL